MRAFIRTGAAFRPKFDRHLLLHLKFVLRVMSNSSSDSDSSDSEDGPPRKRMPGVPRGRSLQHLGRQQLHFQPHHSQQRFSTEPSRYSAVVYRGPPTEANTMSQAQMSGTFIDPRRARNSRSRSRPPNKI